MIYVLSGGQTGATLTITSSGAGTITVSNTTLGKSYSKSVTAGGSVVFKGLKTGTWTIKLTDGSKTSTKTITITSDYSTNIAYFSATINITYPAKSTCVVKNSGGTTVASNTNTGTSAKTWTATVNATGTYTVTATATDGSGKSKSQSVSITADGQSKSVSLSYALILYDNGTQNVAWATYDGGGHGDAKLDSTYMSIKPCPYMPYLYTENKVSTAGYSKLGVEYKSKYTRDDGFSFGTSTDTNLGQYYGIDFVSKKSVLDDSETKKTAECPITSGSFNIVIQSGFEDLTYRDSAYIYIYKVWLE